MSRILGIDIGSRALYGAVVRTAFRKVEVERYVRVPLVSAVDAPGRAPELADAVRGALRALGSPPDTVIAAMGGEEIALHNLELPAAARKRIADVLPFELESLLPFEPSDAIVDHQPVETQGGVLRVLAAAALESRVVARLALLRQAGIEPRELVPSASALEGLCLLLPELKTPAPILIIDIGDEHTDLCVVRNGRCQTARTLSLGMQAFDAQRARGDDLWRGIQRTIAAYRAMGGDAPAAVYLCGLGALVQGSREWLASRLELPVELLPMPPLEGADATTLPAFAKALALAGRGAMGGKLLNLRQGRFAPSQVSGQVQKHAHLLGICAVSLLMSSMFAVKARQSLLIEEQDALRTSLARQTKAIFGKASIDPTEVAQFMRDPAAGNPLPRFDAFDALAAISGAVTPEIKHEVRRLRIEIGGDKQEGRVELQGVIATVKERDAILGKLAQHPCFKDIEPGKTTPDRAGGEISYQLEATLQCPGDATSSAKRMAKSQGAADE